LTPGFLFLVIASFACVRKFRLLYSLPTLGTQPGKGGEMERQNLRVVAGRPYTDHLYAEPISSVDVDQAERRMDEPHRFNPEPWVAAICLLLFALALWVIALRDAHAGDLYLAGSYGQTTMTKTACPKESFSCEPRVVGWKAALGYRVGPHLAFEAQWVDLGRANRYALPSAPVSGGLNTLDAKGTHSFATARGPAVVALGILPLGRFSLYAGLGLHALKVRNGVMGRPNQAQLDAEGTLPSHTEGTSLGPVTELGAQFDLSKRWAARAEFNHYHRVGGSTIGGITEKDLAVVSLVYSWVER
jgi:opacity protein-like surface antigen